MKCCLHSPRKTFATKIVNNDTSVFDAMKLLRHKKVDTTIKYYTSADLRRLGNEANKVFRGNYFHNLNQPKLKAQQTFKVIKLGE
ncbi:MAG: hypothetical protein KDC88_13610 [Ignavibacteriae bacterium]|nr:hypothetical protein [Ignavibacteriota bacterium]